MDEFQEILQDFLVESFELIEQLDQDLVELESTPEDLELLNRIFRVAHTVKGASSFLNFDVLTHLTHHMEDVLNKARHGELIITPDIMDVVLESIDLMKSLLHTIRDTSSDGGIDVSECVKRLDIAAGGEGDVEVVATQQSSEPEAAVETQECAADEDEPNYDDMSDDEVEAEIERLLAERKAADKAKREAKKAASGEGEKKQEPVSPPPAAPKAGNADKKGSKKEEPKAAPAVKKAATTVEQTIRVDVKRLDHLMNLIGELVLGKNRLIKINDDVEERYEGEEFLEELNQVVSIVSLVTTDLQIAVMKTRMLPIGKVFNKFPRMIRDLSRELDKKIELVISGEDTELDKSIVEEIGDPLVHIIRNSCDHGIEPLETRLEAGKSETGTINLKAYNEGNHIVIQIIDDGKGLNPEALKDIAVNKGVITEKEADKMGEKEA
ncbi:MAG: hybrid sensor histidine kinase/response regulator, partial [Sulfurimonas sp.]